MCFKCLQCKIKITFISIKSLLYFFSTSHVPCTANNLNILFISRQRVFNEKFLLFNDTERIKDETSDKGLFSIAHIVYLTNTAWHKYLSVFLERTEEDCWTSRGRFCYVSVLQINKYIYSACTTVTYEQIFKTFRILKLTFIIAVYIFYRV